MKKQNNKESKSNNVKILGGIDTLYYFYKSDTELYHNFYNTIITDNYYLCDYTDSLGLNFKLEFLCKTSSKTDGIAGGFKYEFKKNDIKVASIIFKSPYEQKQILNTRVKLYASGIYSFGIKKSIDFVSDLLYELYDYKCNYCDMQLSQVDLNCFVQGFDFSKATDEMFKGDYYKNGKVSSYDYRDKGSLETLYLGSVTSSHRFKLYNKLLEMKDKIKKDYTPIKLAFLERNGFNTDLNDKKNHLWNLEFSLKREYLKEYNVYTIQNLFDFFKNLYCNCFYNVEFLGFDLKKIRKHREHKHINRLDTHPVWELIQNNNNFVEMELWGDEICKRITKKSKEKSENYANDELIRLLKRFKDYKLAFNENSLNELKKVISI